MMTAVAHQFDDGPPIDPAEAEMPAADFRIIERAHELCGHAAVRELSADLGNSELSNTKHASLLPRATKILGAQIRARELLAELKQRGELSDLIADEPTDEVDPPVIDWQQVAQDAWHSEGWAQAAKEYQVSNAAGVRR
jgi:hypothetical protein